MLNTGGYMSFEKAVSSFCWVLPTGVPTRVGLYNREAIGSLV